MLKDQLGEQNNVLKTFPKRGILTEQLIKSWRKKLMLGRRKLFHHNLSLLTLILDNAVGQFNKILGTTEETRGALTRLQSRQQSQKIYNNKHARKPVTVISGDSIIQNIRGWSISKSCKDSSL